MTDGRQNFPGPGVLVTDGGLATELEARGHDLSDALWSARLLDDMPSEITAAHVSFFRAGAVIATTASYQASFDGFAARGIERDDAAKLLLRSVELAQAAREEVGGDGRQRWIAASVGPYGAALADGSEYRGRYGLSVAALKTWHRPRLEILAQAGADLLALETVPDVDEAEALVSLVDELGVPAWLTFNVAGDQTRAGQPMAEAFSVAAASPHIVAVGVNCCSPADAAPAISAARSITGKPAIAYPNSGEGWDSQRHAWTGPSQFSPAMIRQWIDAGATIVGGCCRVGPTDIAAVASVAEACRPRSSTSR